MELEKVYRIEIVFVLLTVFFASFLGHFAGDDLADVLDGELSLLDGVFRLHPPTASVLSPVNHQPGLKFRAITTIRQTLAT